MSPHNPQGGDSALRATSIEYPSPPNGYSPSAPVATSSYDKLQPQNLNFNFDNFDPQQLYHQSPSQRHVAQSQPNMLLHSLDPSILAFAGTGSQQEILGQQLQHGGGLYTNFQDRSFQQQGQFGQGPTDQVVNMLHGIAQPISQQNGFVFGQQGQYAHQGQPFSQDFFAGQPQSSKQTFNQAFTPEVNNPYLAQLAQARYLEQQVHQQAQQANPFFSPHQGVNVEANPFTQKLLAQRSTPPRKQQLVTQDFQPPQVQAQNFRGYNSPKVHTPKENSYKGHAIAGSFGVAQQSAVTKNPSNFQQNFYPQQAYVQGVDGYSSPPNQVPKGNTYNGRGTAGSNGSTGTHHTSPDRQLKRKAVEDDLYSDRLDAKKLRGVERPNFPDIGSGIFCVGNGFGSYDYATGMKPSPPQPSDHTHGTHGKRSSTVPRPHVQNVGIPSVTPMARSATAPASTPTIGQERRIPRPPVAFPPKTSPAGNGKAQGTTTPARSSPLVGNPLMQSLTPSLQDQLQQGRLHNLPSNLQERILNDGWRLSFEHPPSRILQMVSPNQPAASLEPTLQQQSALEAQKVQRQPDKQTPSPMLNSGPKLPKVQGQLEKRKRKSSATPSVPKAAPARDNQQPQQNGQSAPPSMANAVPSQDRQQHQNHSQPTSFVHPQQRRPVHPPAHPRTPVMISDFAMQINGVRYDTRFPKPSNIVKVSPYGEDKPPHPDTHPDWINHSWHPQPCFCCPNGTPSEFIRQGARFRVSVPPPPPPEILPNEHILPENDSSYDWTEDPVAMDVFLARLKAEVAEGSPVQDEGARESEAEEAGETAEGEENGDEEGDEDNGEEGNDEAEAAVGAVEVEETIELAEEAAEAGDI